MRVWCNSSIGSGPSASDGGVSCNVQSVLGLNLDRMSDRAGGVLVVPLRPASDYAAEEATIRDYLSNAAADSPRISTSITDIEIAPTLSNA